MPLDTSTQITIGGIGCWDEDAKEHYELNNSYAKRILRCPWNDRNALCQYLKAGSSLVAGTPFYLVGQPYPDQPNFLCAIADTDGDGTRSIGPFGMVAYERAKVTAIYKPPEFNIGSPLEIGTQELDFSSSSEPLHPTSPSFKWTSDGAFLPPGIVPVFRSTTAQFVQARFNVPSIPFNTIMSLLDTVNSGSFFGAGAERVRFLGGRSTRGVTASGTFNWNITYSFSVTGPNRTWNQKFRPGSGWAAFTDLGGNKMYTPADFNGLYNT